MPVGQSFFAKVVLQPYAAVLASAAIRPSDRPMRGGDNFCPVCGGAPQLSFLETAADADGGGRHLQCATCFTVWPFRRVLCAHCGEENEPRLGYYHSPAFDHVRVDACETCRRYLKTVDLTRLGPRRSAGGRSRRGVARSLGPRSRLREDRDQPDRLVTCSFPTPSSAGRRVLTPHGVRPAAIHNPPGQDHRHRRVRRCAVRLRGG